MARIRSKDTKLEIWLQKKLFVKGYQYRKNEKMCRDIRMRGLQGIIQHSLFTVVSGTGIKGADMHIYQKVELNFGQTSFRQM